MKSSNIHGSLDLPLNTKAFTPVPWAGSQADVRGQSMLFLCLLAKPSFSRRQNGIKEAVKSAARLSYQ